MPAEKDREFQSALKAHRIMTVRQHNVGSKADAGTVGYEKNGESILLIFPRSLKQYEHRSVVGINYDLLKKSETEETTKSAKMKAKTPAAKSKTRSKHASQMFEPLRVFTPELKVASKEEGSPAHEEPASNEDHKRLEKLTSEVRKALKKLENGNAVAAYKLLEKSDLMNRLPGTNFLFAARTGAPSSYQRMKHRPGLLRRASWRRSGNH